MRGAELVMITEVPGRHHRNVRRFDGFDPDLYANRSIARWAKAYEQERRDQEDMSILDKFREMAAKGLEP